MPGSLGLPRDGSNGGQDATAFAAMSAATTPTRNMPCTPPDTPPYETAFYSRPDARLPSRQTPALQPTKDSRQHVPDRTVLTGQDCRRELLTQERSHGSPRPARADTPDVDKASIERLQAEISAKQSKLSHMKHHHEQQALMVLPAGYEDPDSETEQSYALDATEQRPMCFSYPSSSLASTRSSTFHRLLQLASATVERPLGLQCLCRRADAVAPLLTFAYHLLTTPTTLQGLGEGGLTLCVKIQDPLRAPVG